MSQKEIINILYNPGSISTCGTGKDADGLAEISSYDLGEEDYDVLVALEDLVQSNSPETALACIESFREQVAAGVSVDLRPIIMREFNNYLGRAARLYPKIEVLFEKSLAVIFAFKREMDKEEQQVGHVSQGEWIELEKALYCLTVWEENFSSTKGEKIAVKVLEL